MLGFQHMNGGGHNSAHNTHGSYQNQEINIDTILLGILQTLCTYSCLVSSVFFSLEQLVPQLFFHDLNILKRTVQLF